MKKTIVCIIGESGSGKTTFAEYTKNKHNVNMIESYTDREKRTPDEIGHTFLSKKEFDNLHHEDMIAFTEFGGKRYCCLHSQVEDLCTYVIDEFGLGMLQRLYSLKYNLVSVRLIRPVFTRKEHVGQDRIDRDVGKFGTPLEKFDYIVESLALDDLHKDADRIILDIKRNNE